MEHVGIDGFDWVEIEIENKGRKTKSADLVIRKYKNLPNRVAVLADYMDMAGFKSGDKLKLMAQGKAIFMLQKGEGEIAVGRHAGRFYSIGGVDLARKLFTRAEAYTFELVDVEEGYIMFRPIKETV